MSRNVITDGFTRQLRINATELHDELTGEYRPMLAEQVRALDAEMDARKDLDGGSALLTASTLAKHLTSWSEIDEEGCPVSISAETVRRLPAPLLRRLHLVLSGYSQNDSDPDEEPSEAATTDRVAQIRKELSGDTTTDLEEQQGNSEGA